MQKLQLLAVAALLAAPAALASDMPKAVAIGYLASVGVDRGGTTGDDSGIGIGVRGWASLEPHGFAGFFAHGEYQTVSLDDFNEDIESLRLGGGMVGQINPQMMWLAKGEYINFGSDSDEAGFGAHGGVMFMPNEKFGVGGTLGFLSTSNTSGVELNVGGHFAINRELSVVGDIRNYMGSPDRGSDYNIFELRAGVGYAFY